MIVEKVRRAMRRSPLLFEERGLSTVEYVIILVLIAVLCIGVWKNFGTTVQRKIEDSTARINELSTEGQASPESR